MDETPKEVVAPVEGKVVKAKHHVKKHKKKYGAASIVALLAAALELWPLVCPVLPFQLQCKNTKPIADKLMELDSAGNLP